MNQTAEQVLRWLHELTDRVVELVNHADDAATEAAETAARNVHEIAHRITEYLNGGHVDPAKTVQVVPDLNGLSDEFWKTMPGGE